MRQAMRQAMKHAWIIPLALLAAAMSMPVRADTTVELRESLAGNMNFVMTGGSLRTQDNNGDACAVTNFDTATLSGIPGGSTILRAYLYYAGSGDTVDANITFNGNNLTADRTFTATYNNGGTLLNFFSGFVDVTAYVNGNGNYSFSNLNVSTGNPWCPVAAVLSGWALVVIYEHDTQEDFRVINLFDGFQTFRGNSITLTPSNFQVPVSPINGKHGVISWEGDVENSTDMNGESEDITFNGVDLTDALDPAGNQFNSTINQQGITTSYGVDIDSYDVDGLLNPGDTSATTVYSSGADLVILSAEVMSVTNTPVSDLAIDKSHAGDFVVGQDGSYTLQVSNAGPNNTSGTTTVTDTLPAGLTYVNASGSGWSCGAVGQNVTCTRNTAIAAGANAPPITLAVAVDSAAYPGVSNTATVSGGNFDNHSDNDSDTDTATVLSVDLTTSTKSVVDLNGGDALPGDILRYTITLNETGGVAATAAVTDDIPALVENFNVVSYPAGATNASTPFGGANGNGYLDISGIAIPANGTAEIVFDVTIEAAASNGSQINNTATVTPQAGVGASPASPPVTIASSSLPQTGNKLLYLYSGPEELQRAPPGGTEGDVVLDEGETETFAMTPAAAAPIQIASPPTVNLYVYETGSGSTRNGEVRLYRASSPGTYFSATFSQFISNNDNNPTLLQLTLNGGTASAPLTLATGDRWVLRVDNDTGGSGQRRLVVMPNPNGNNSTVELDSNNVINIDSLAAYSTPYPGTTQPATFGANQAVYLRAVVSDPFGSADITGATIDVTDANGAIVANNAAMTIVDSDALTKTYEYQLTVPVTGPTGFWTLEAVATEGTEGTVNDNQLGAFEVYVVPTPDLSTSTKTVQDINGGEAEPGDTLRYTITLNETAGVAATAATVTDDIPGLVENFTVISVPAGATDASTFAGTGANGTGFLDIGNINVPANGSVEIVFEVSIDGAATAGSTIDNTANVAPATGLGATPAAPTVTVKPSAVPQTGNKLLYLYSAPDELRRVPPTGAEPAIQLNNGNTATFNMTPSAAGNIELASEPSLDLYLYISGGFGFVNNRSFDARVYRASDPATVFTGSAASNGWSQNAGAPSLVTLTLDGGAAAPLTLAAGDAWVLEIQNTSGDFFGSLNIHIVPNPAAGNSALNLESNNVINVDSVDAYISAYPGTTVPTYFTAGDTVRLRAVVSDPFGSFDITGATIDIDDPDGTPHVSGAAMTEVADSGTLTKTYEYSFVVPNDGPGGVWDVNVTAAEGTEGTVTDIGFGTFNVVLMPNISLVKFAQVLSDPINGTSNPKAVPGAVMAYSITATNSGLGSADAGSIVIRTQVPADATLYVDTGSGDPVAFADGTNPSGLVFNYATDVSYSNQPGGGPPFNYVPVPDGSGYDASVTGIQIMPGGGDFNPSGGAPHPSFTISFRVRVD